MLWRYFFIQNKRERNINNYVANYQKPKRKNKS